MKFEVKLLDRIPYLGDKRLRFVGAGGYKNVYEYPGGEYVVKVFLRGDPFFGPMTDDDVRRDLGALWSAHCQGLNVALPVYVNLDERWYIQRKVKMATPAIWETVGAYFRPILKKLQYPISDVRYRNVGLDENDQYIIVDCFSPMERS